jgi:hypothetical protein|tara:strand:+ start:736 stop:2682 length:1947 start_codon:yes stop_codon:yes gene_type:complete
MSFITNISTTPITGIYDEDGKPSGINEVGTTTSKFSSVTDATTNLVPSTYASGISNSSSYPFSNSGLTVYGPNMVTGLKVSSDSSNIAPNYSKGNVSTQLLTSLREGDWDRFNGWREPINSSLARGFATINPLETGMNISSNKNISPDRGNKKTSVSFLAPGAANPVQAPIGVPIDDDCNNCPYTLEDEKPTYAPKIRKCDVWASELSCFPEEFVTRSLFSGVIPAYNDDGFNYFVTGYFVIDWTYLNIGGGADYGPPERGGPTTPNEDQYDPLFYDYFKVPSIEEHEQLLQIFNACLSCIDDIEEKVGRECTWGYMLGDTTLTQVYYVGDSDTIGNNAEQSGIKWTGWCAEHDKKNFMDQTFYEVSPGCNNGSPPITQLVGCTEVNTGLFEPADCISNPLDYIRDIEGPYGCRCKNRYDAGFSKRSNCAGSMAGDIDGTQNMTHLSSKILSDWDAIITSGSSNCSTMVNIVDPYTCSRIEEEDGEPKLYVPWPTGLTPEGATISGGDVTGYADPYWNDNYCDFVVGVREIVKVEADECADQGLNCGGLEAFQASGNVIEYPFYKLQVAKNIQTDFNYFESSTECIRANSPTPTGTGEDPCGSDCVWMWDGSDWYVSSSGENCLDCGTGPSSPGGMINDVISHPCDCS